MRQRQPRDPGPIAITHGFSGTDFEPLVRARLLVLTWEPPQASQEGAAHAGDDATPVPSPIAHEA